MDTGLRLVASPVSGRVSLCSLRWLAHGRRLLPRATSIQDAARAMGVANLQSIQYSGSGSSFTVGQAPGPGAPWPRFELAKYVASVNYADRRCARRPSDATSSSRHVAEARARSIRRRVRVACGPFRATSFRVSSGTAAPMPASSPDLDDASRVPEGCRFEQGDR